MFATIAKIAPIFFFAVLLLAPCDLCCSEQTSDDSECSTVYENHNQIDYGRVKVNVVQGGSRAEVGDQIFPWAPGACLVLFTEKDHKLVSSIKAGQYGDFDFGDVAPGRYRLIARAEGFCTANIPIRVVKSTHIGKLGFKLGILVYFLPKGMARCSYGEKLFLIDSKGAAGAH